MFLLKEGNCAATELGSVGHGTSAATTSHTGEISLRNISTDLQSLSRAPPSLKSPEGHSLTLNYETEDEDRIVEEIVAMGSSSAKDPPPLTVAFLLCICIQYSSTCLHNSELRRLLLLIASGVQSAMWVSYGKIHFTRSSIKDTKLL